MRPRRLQLDYIAAARRSQAAGILVLSLSIIATSMLVYRYREVSRELQRIEASQGLLSTDRKPVRSVTPQKLQDEAKSTEIVLRQLALPWSDIIDTVEAAAIPDVSILQLQPDAQQRQLRLVAEARNSDAMFEYVKGLAAAKSLGDVSIVSHQIQETDPRRPVQFAVQASLKGLP